MVRYPLHLFLYLEQLGSIYSACETVHLQTLVLSTDNSFLFFHLIRLIFFRLICLLCTCPTLVILRTEKRPSKDTVDV